MTRDTWYGILVPAQEFPGFLKGEVYFEKVLRSLNFKAAGGHFFMYPFFEFFGWDPLTIKGVQAGGKALAAGVMFLALNRKFDVTTAATTVLLLPTMGIFMFGHNLDMHVIYPLSALFLYFFIRWRERFRSRNLFYMDLIAGFGTYAKATVLFPFAAFS